MKLESVFLMVFLIILVASSPAALGVQRVEASGTVCIRADGSIDPPDAPISTLDNVIYTLTGNITSDADGIVLERDNIVVDGSGFAVEGVGAGSLQGISLIGRSNVTIRNTNIKNFSYAGIYLFSSSNNSISGNTITENSDYGIWLGDSSDISISRNNITANSSVGIKLENCLNINIVNNDITDNDLAGIWLFFSNSSLVSQNRITRTHTAGIILDISSNNTIIENDVRDNRANMVFEYSVNGGVALSSRNRIFHNNFSNGTWNVIPHFSGQPENSWDDGYPSGGNYWSDYNGTDANHDGIGDTAYVIDANNTDKYPLMSMFYSIDIAFLPGFAVTLISNSTISFFNVVTVIENIEPETSKGIPTIFINFTDQTGYGFCRVSIPHALMNISNIPVTIDHGFTTVLQPNYMLYDNGTHRWIYFAYEQSPSPLNQTSHLPARIMIIPEFPSFLILPLFFIATLLAVIIYRKKHPQNE